MFGQAIGGTAVKRTKQTFFRYTTPVTNQHGFYSIDRVDRDDLLSRRVVYYLVQNRQNRAINMMGNPMQVKGGSRRTRKTAPLA